MQAWFIGDDGDTVVRTTEGDVLQLANLPSRFRGRKFHAVWEESLRRQWQGQSGAEFNTSAFGNLVAVLAMGSKTFQRITEQSPGETVEHFKDIVTEFQLWYKIVYRTLDPPLRNPEYVLNLRGNLLWRAV